MVTYFLVFILIMILAKTRTLSETGDTTKIVEVWPGLKAKENFRNNI